MHVSTRQNLFTRLQKKRFEKYFNENIFGAKNQKFVILLRAILEEGESHISKVAKLNKEISVRCICVKLNIQNCESFKLFSSILWPTLVPNCLKLDITVL